MEKITLIVFIALFLAAPLTEAGNPGDWPDLKTNSGGDGPYNRGGYSPKGMDGVIRGDGVYMTPAPGGDTYYGKDIYDESQEELDAQDSLEEGHDEDDLDLDR